MTRLFWVRSRAVIAASALLAAGCQSNSDELSDIGANPPPVEFQAACLRLPRGAVVSLTHKPTLGVVLRTISPKEGTSVRWERVSNTSYIQRMEWSDPLTGKAGEFGMMFNKLATAPTPECPNGEVLLARMVVNGEEAAPAVMNDAFLSLVNVAALNAPRRNVASAPPPEAAVPPQPDMPQPDPETGCYGDDCPAPAGSYIPEGSGDPSVRAGDHPPCYTREDGTLAC